MKKFLILLFLFIVLLLSPQGVLARTKVTKFIQVTDVHYVVQNERANEYLKALANDINRIRDIDFVVFTGDNIDSPSAENLHGFLRATKKINVPCYFVIGNHDVSTNAKMDKDKYLDVIRYHNWFYPAWKPNYKFEKKGMVFVLVDGAKQIIPGPNGYYKQDTLAWLDKILDKNKKKPVIILQHFPVVAPYKSNSHKTYKAENYLEMLDKHENVVAVVSGHYHFNKEEMRNGVYHVSTPAFTDPPHYYKLIEIVSTKNFLPMIFTQLREIDL